MAYRVQFVGFLAVVAVLTAVALALNSLGARSGLIWVRYIAVLLVYFCPGLLYVRLHPAWRARSASGASVGLATGAAVFAGVVLGVLVIQLRGLTAQPPADPQVREIARLVGLSLTAPLLAGVLSFRAYTRAPQLIILRPLRTDGSGLSPLGHSSIPDIWPRLRRRNVVLALCFVVGMPVCSLLLVPLPWAAAGTAAARIAAGAVHVISLLAAAAFGWYVLAQASTQFSRDGVTRLEGLRRVALRWSEIDRVLWGGGLLELGAQARQIRIDTSFFSDPEAVKGTILRWAPKAVMR